MSGLMSDPEKRNKLFAVISKRQTLISFLLFVGGIAGFATLCHIGFAQRTYFSENALLPGVVDETFSSSDRKKAVELISEVAQKFENSTGESEPNLAPWLQEKFEQFGLEAYQQSFKLSFPTRRSAAHHTFYGTNVYGILRAPRSAGHEGIALVAPIQTTGPYVQSNSAGIGLLLALAKVFAEKNFWARDIAFVVPAMDFFGQQAWLNAYSAPPPLGDKSALSAGNQFVKLESSPLDARCGALQAALILELGPNPNPPRVDLRLEGVNGLLPNLDYVNLVVRVAEKHGISISLQNRTDSRKPLTFDGYLHAMKTLMRQMGALAQFAPTGLHGLFLPLRVEALTMSAEPPRPSRRLQGGAPDILAVGRLLEATVRAVNNLQERFHQSFFFYLLPCTHFFLSIGPYMGAFGAILAAPLLHALALWIGARTPPAGSTSPASSQDVPSAVHVWPYLVVSMIAGAICYASIPRLWYTSVSTFTVTPAQGMVLSFSSLLLVFIVFLPRSPLFNKGDISTYPDWRLAKSVSILFICLVLGALGLLNFSFAFFSGLLLISATLFAKPSSSKVVRLLRVAMILLLASPLTLAVLLCGLHPVAPLGSSVAEHVGELFMKSLNDHYVHGSHFWTAFSLAYLPAWIFLFFIPFLPLDNEPQVVKETTQTEEGDTKGNDDQ